MQPQCKAGPPPAWPTWPTWQGRPEDATRGGEREGGDPRPTRERRGASPVSPPPPPPPPPAPSWPEPRRRCSTKKRLHRSCTQSRSALFSSTSSGFSHIPPPPPPLPQPGLSWRGRGRAPLPAALAGKCSAGGASAGRLPRRRRDALQAPASPARGVAGWLAGIRPLGGWGAGLGRRWTGREAGARLSWGTEREREREASLPEFPRMHAPLKVGVYVCVYLHSQNSPASIHAGISCEGWGALSPNIF